MIYRPPFPKHMWDCTLFYDKPDYHLFYLSDGNIGHSSTRDFIHFIEYPDIEGHGESGSWNSIGLPLTGTLVKTDTGYKMLLGSIEPVHNRQVYGLYTSSDLIHWKEYEQNPVLKADGIIYQKETNPRDWNMYTAWRDPYVVGKEGDWYILCMCARLQKHDANSTGAAVAKIKTKDFIRFEYCPPYSEVGDFTKYAECPDIFVLNGKKYLLFLDHAWGGLHPFTKSRHLPAGTFYQVYDEQTKAFVFQNERLLLGSANNRQCAWAARSVLGENEQRLLYYHITAEFPSFGIPKIIHSDKDGSLHLSYFPQTDNLCAETIFPHPTPLPGDCGHWKFENDRFLGKAQIYGSALPIATAENCMFECDITLKRGLKAGFAFWHGADERIGGVTVWLDAETNRIYAAWEHYRDHEGFGDLQDDVVNGGTLRECDEKFFPAEYNTPYRFKVIAKDKTVDVYLNDEWVICKRFPMCADSGYVSLLTQNADAEFSVVRFCTLKNPVIEKYDEI